MFKNLKNALNVFKNKKIIIVLMLILISFFGFNFITNTIVDEFVLGVSFKEFPSFAINYYGFSLIWMLLLCFLFLFTFNYSNYLISHTINESKKKIISDISNCFMFTLLFSLVLLTFGIFYYLSIVYLGAFSIFGILLLQIISFVVMLVLMFGILFLAVSSNINESLKRSWIFIQKKFWKIILLVVVIGLIYWGWTYLFDLLIAKYMNLEIIIYPITSTILITYIISVFSSLIKK